MLFSCYSSPDVMLEHYCNHPALLLYFAFVKICKA